MAKKNRDVGYAVALFGAKGVIRILLYVLVAIFFISIARMSFVFGYSIFNEQAIASEPGQDVLVEIPEGASTREIADILVAGEYYYGYATQWNANIFTEYSNGLIDMHDWIDGSVSEVKTVDMSNKWLQPLSHDTVIPEGKVFLLYGKGELDQVVWKDNLLDEDVVVKSDNFIVYGFNSYDEMKMKIQDGV